jgi:ABC-2 type transport system ATP-binding protein
LSKRALFGMVRAIAAQGAAALWATSSLGEAAQCDLVLLLSDGQVLAMAAPVELAGRLAGRTRAIDAKHERAEEIAARLREAPGILDVRVRRGRLRLVTDAPDRALPPLPGGDAGPIRDVSPTLEDATIVLLAARTIAAAIAPRKPRPPPVAPPHQPALHVRHLAVRREGRLVLDGIQFDLERGGVLGLIGPNGSGKSTALRAVCGLLPSAHGEISIGSVDLRSEPTERRARLGFMGEDCALYDELTAGQNLLFFGAAYGLPRRALADRIDRLAADFRLPLDARAGELPFPLRRRLSLAAAAIHGPAFLLLDEPTLGMDAVMRRDFWSCLHGIIAQGIGLAVASQDMEDAEECDSLLLLSNGSSVASGSLEELLSAAAAAGSAGLSLEDAFIVLAGASGRGRAA